MGGAQDVEEFLACESREERQCLLSRRFNEYFDRLAMAVKLRLDRRVARRYSVRDVLQETYLEAHRRIDEYTRQPGFSLFLWLRFLAVQKVKTLYRQNLKKAPLKQRNPVRLRQYLMNKLGSRQSAVSSQQSKVGSWQSAINS